MFMVFAVYLGNQSEQAILFLIMVFCFVFLDVLNFIHNLYVYSWIFEFLDKSLYVFAIFLLYKYVKNYHLKTRKASNLEANQYRIKQCF